MFEYTEEQLKVIEESVSSVHSGTRVFISGPAGSGKTTICKEIARQLSQIHGYKIIYGAFTKTACKQLEDNIGSEVSTIHSLLGKKLQSIVNGNLTFSKASQVYHDNNVVIIDEASMISVELFDELVTSFKKIIFLGDVYQIPPIPDNDDKMRLITIDEYKPAVAFKEKVPVKFKLKTVHRQDTSSGLYNLCMGLRESIRTGDCLYLYNQDNMQEFIYHYAKEYDDGTVQTDINSKKVVPFLTENPNSCFIAYGRSMVQTVQDKLPEWYKSGGLGRLNKGISKIVTDNGRIVESNTILNNNEDVIIKNIIKKENTKWGIVFDEVETDDGISFLVPSYDDYEDHYAEILEALLYNKNKKVAEIEGWHVPEIPLKLLRTYQEYEYRTITDDTFNSFFCEVSTLRDPRTCTAHKSQGQQWDNVIVAVNNVLFSGKNLDDRDDEFRLLTGMKLLYTAISRAKQKIVFSWAYSKKQY